MYLQWTPVKLDRLVTCPVSEFIIRSPLHVPYCCILYTLYSKLRLIARQLIDPTAYYSHILKQIWIFY